MTDIDWKQDGLGDIYADVDVGGRAARLEVKPCVEWSFCAVAKLDGRVVGCVPHLPSYATGMGRAVMLLSNFIAMTEAK